MTKLSALHQKWMEKPEYREAYKEMAPEFELAAAILHTLREFEADNPELKATYVNIERVAGYAGDLGIAGFDVTVEVK